MTNHQLERWLVWEIHGRQIPRKPPQRASALSHKPARDYRYRAWIRSLPSAASGLTPCHACHTGPHALGEKSSDYTCIPLTPEEHREYDRDPTGFQVKHGFDVAELVKGLTRHWFTSRKSNRPIDRKVK